MRVEKFPKFIENAERIEKALEIVEKTYKKGIDIIKEDEFKDLYSKETVEADLEWVRKEEERFEKEDTPEQKEARKVSTVFEAIIFDQVEANNWLGETARTIKSSRYDDIKNGIDLIVEFPEEELSASHLALAVDVTLSSELENKLRDIKRDIERGKMGTIKYFKSEALNIRGEKSNIPKVVIGTDYHTFTEVVDLWMSRDTAEGGAAKDKLVKHPIQFILLEEILMQLEKFEDYARKIKQEKVAEEYKRVKEIIEEVYRKKLVLYEELLNKKDVIVQKDGVYQAIQNYLDRLSSQKIRH